MKLKIQFNEKEEKLILKFISEWQKLAEKDITMYGSFDIRQKEEIRGFYKRLGFKEIRINKNFLVNATYKNHRFKELRLILNG